MKVYWGTVEHLHTLLASSLDKCKWSASWPSHFTPSTHSIGGCVGPTAGLDTLEIRKFFAPGRNQTSTQSSSPWPSHYTGYGQDVQGTWRYSQRYS